MAFIDLSRFWCIRWIRKIYEELQVVGKFVKKPSHVWYVLFATHSNLRNAAGAASIAVAAPGHTPCSERAPPKSRERASDSSSAGYLGSKYVFPIPFEFICIYIFIWGSTWGSHAILYSSQGQIYLILLNFNIYIYMIFRFISKMDLYTGSMLSIG